jgi:hypothetical protein
MSELPTYVPREFVAKRLPLIFPEGTPNRNYCIRELAASTIFTMLYIGAVEGGGRYLAPKHVYRMTDQQAAKSGPSSRQRYGRTFVAAGSRWYADNTREPIRDETLREGLVAVGAVAALADVPTTSSRPRYFLKAHFAGLFDPALDGATLEKAIADFQKNSLSPGALARILLNRALATQSTADVLVKFPNGETRILAPGPSAKIAQAVIEVFAEAYLQKAAVLWLSDSARKVVARDDQISAAIGLKIDASRNLPDIILVDLGPKDPLIIFVEVVATDGAITSRRQDALFALTDGAGFKRAQVAFLTAYQDRESAGFKKTVSGLAWRSFAWFVSEPDHIVILRHGAMSPAKLPDLMAIV